MTKSFQKTASSLRELQITHPGIINSKDFNAQFELHCYKPSADLQPFVTHIWTQRRRTEGGPTRKPLEILSGPNIYLFFTPETAFIHGVTSEFQYDPYKAGTTAGIKFRPGGFQAFARTALADIPPLTSIFPEANEAFRKRLLDQPDETIVTMLEALLRSHNPTRTKKLALVTQILSALEHDVSLQTVKDVAQAFSMSERSLQLLFQTYVGVGLKWIITRRRLVQATQRAQASNRLSWSEIAAELGYSSQSHFSRDFKRIIGLSPSEYLRNAI